MPEADCEQTRTCICCGRGFSLEEVQWLVSNQTEKFFAQDSDLRDARGRFESAMDAFLCLDTRGSAFCNFMGGGGPNPIQTQRIRLVTPENVALKVGEAAVFCRLEPEDPAYPGLRFTDEFVKQVDPNGDLNVRDAKDDIEHCGIRPVCPHCTSYLPDLLLARDDASRVIRLGLVGPARSGKTTLNAVNILCGCLNCGGWVVSAVGIKASSHYLLDSYYKPLLDGGEIPLSMPDSDYIPPLLIQMEHGARRVLLELLDIPAKVLQAIRGAVQENARTPRTARYLSLLRQLDGCLLFLDACQEIMPVLEPNIEPVDGEGERPMNLESLVQVFSGIRGWSRKPAALLISKCDWLFGPNGKTGTDKLDKLFNTFSDVDKLLWQRSREADSYSADHHEAVQYAFKPLIRERFPTLWAYLERYFSRVDVFTQSNWDVGLESNGSDGDRAPDSLEPFHNADPIIWLLNMMR